MKNKKLNSKQKKALELFNKKLDAKLRSHLNSCVRCGLCGDYRHYYLANKDEKFIPGKKVDLIAQIYRRYHTFAGRLIPN